MIALSALDQSGDAPTSVGVALIEPQFGPIMDIVDRQ